MFRILVIDNRDSITKAIKYLLYRYEVVFSRDVKDAITKLKDNIIDMILVNLPFPDGLSSSCETLKEWIQRKKTIVIADPISTELVDEAKKLGAEICIDKLEIPRLPELVGRFLNQAETKILTLQG